MSLSHAYVAGRSHHPVNIFVYTYIFRKGRSARDVAEAPFLRCFGKSDILIILWNLVCFCNLLNGLPILKKVCSSYYTYYYIISFWLTTQTYFAISVLIPINFSDCSILQDKGTGRTESKSCLRTPCGEGSFEKRFWGMPVGRVPLERGFQDSCAGSRKKKIGRCVFFFWLPFLEDTLLIRQPKQWSRQSSWAGRSGRKERTNNRRNFI